MTESLESVELPAALVNEIINGEDGAPDISLLQKMTGIQHAMNGTSGMQGQPCLQITEQPKSRGFRFRYGCEGPSHGGIPGIHSEKNRKTYPAVKIVGYQGYARIVVTLMTNEEAPRPHAHYLVGKQCNEDGFCVVQVGPKDMTATFPNLGVLHVTKKNVPAILEKRKMKELVAARRCQETGKIIPDFDNLNEDECNKYITEQDKKQIVKESQEQAKQMDLSAVRVCFQAFLQDENGSYTRTLTPVISDAVFDSKAPNASTLKICRMDRHSGCVTGGDEVFLLCDKVQKDDIQVRFFEEADDSTNGGSEWEAYGDFGPADVHRQFAIVFKTPPYHNVAIDRPISVHVQLRRKSDGELSDPKPFTYQPQQFDKEEIGKKRKKTVPHFNTHFGGGGPPGGPTAGGGFGPGGMYGGGFGFGGTVGGGGTFHFGGGGAFQAYGGGGGMKDQGSVDRPIRQPEEDDDLVVDSAPPDDDDLITDSAPTEDSMAMSKAHIGGDSQAGLKGQAVSLGPQPWKPSAFTKPTPADKQKGSAEPSRAALQYGDVAWQLAERTANALRDYAITGDVRMLLAVQRHLTAVQDDEGDTSLHLAIIHSNPLVVQNLLHVTLTLPDLRVINQYNHLRQTPLHLAVITQQPQVADLLVRCGANPWLPDRHGNSAVHLAAKAGDEKSLQAILRNIPAQAPGITNTPDINAHNFEGFTPVHLAVMAGSLGALKELVTGQTDVNVPDGKSGRTALHHAVENENLAITGYLILEAGADVDAQNFDGNTPLHVASGRGMLGMAALLMAAGADPKLENYEAKEEEEEGQGSEVAEAKGQTPLDLAASDEMRDILSGKPYVPKHQRPDVPHFTHTKGTGDLSTLDGTSRLFLSKALDEDNPGRDWAALAERLGLGNLSNAFKLRPSPTTALLENFEMMDGTVAKLRAGLEEIGRRDAINIIDGAIKGKPEVSMVTEAATTATAPVTLEPEKIGHRITSPTFDSGLEQSIVSMQLSSGGGSLPEGMTDVGHHKAGGQSEQTTRTADVH
ncbi:NFKB1 [Branchiostoma lanceolatum]|uniref:NFKB1 protein n=2 Tax=Branchiostoma lanceolatum TaxID=7740 RepID=A0A8K0ECU1_BRALA|nr:NFKB1 [Branchiostoma lanceolatum]